MKKIICIAVSLLILIAIPYTHPTQLKAEDNGYIELSNPHEIFWGNKGNWEYIDGEYVGYSPTPNTDIFSYTDFGAFSTMENAVSSMNGYKVKMVVKRPVQFSDTTSRIIVGSKCSGDSILGQSFIVDFARSGMNIYNFSLIPVMTTWFSLDSSIGTGDEFVFEISVTCEEIKVWVNNDLKFTGEPEEGMQKGLFGVGGIHTDEESVVSFSNVEYMFFDPPQCEEIKLRADSASPHKIQLELCNFSSGDLFQVWIKSEEIFDLFNEEKTLMWVLGKKFDEDTENIIITPEGAHYTFTVPCEFQTPKGRYEINIRVIREGEGIIFSQRAKVACMGGDFVISHISLNNQEIQDFFYYEGTGKKEKLTIRIDTQGSLSEQDDPRYRIIRSGVSPPDQTPPANNFKTLTDGPENSCTFVIPDEGGMYTFRVTAYSSLYPDTFRDEREFKILVGGSGAPVALFENDEALDLEDIVVGGALEFNLSHSVKENEADIMYRYSIGEAWKPPLISKTYSSNSYCYTGMDYPGIYQIVAYISHKANSRYDDGLIRYVNVERHEHGDIRGRAQTENVTLHINGHEFEGDPLSSPVTINVGDLAEIHVQGSGLSGPGTSGEADDYLFSFWRLNSRGYREVKSWSPDSSQAFRPAAPGHYSIHIRIKGEDARSYEDTRTVRFIVSDYVEVDSLELKVHTEDISVLRPVEIEAVATGPGDYIYRFEVWDMFLGTRTLRGFSPDNTLRWIPAKRGNYRLIVRAQDPSSLGFGDRVTTKDLVIE